MTPISRNILICLVIFVFLCAVGLRSAEAEITWQEYKTGMAQGKKENKKILVKFSAQWCTYCKQMDRTTFSDPHVTAYIKKYFVPVEVDTDKQKGLAVNYRVSSLPITWFLTPDGDRLYAAPGYVAPKMFLYLLEYVGEDNYQKGNLQDFLERRK